MTTTNGLTMFGAEREGAAMLQEFARRLNHLCDEAGIPPKGQGRQVKLAAVLKVTQRASRRWLEGLGMPSRALMRRIANLFRCNLLWLENGEGEKRPQATSAPVIAGNQVLLTLTRAQELLIQAFAERHGLPYDIAAREYFMLAINADLDRIGHGSRSTPESDDKPRRRRGGFFYHERDKDN